MHILIAEDHYVIQMVLEISMTEWGYGFDMAFNGLEAVEYARTKPGQYDLCIMDVFMPVMGGIEATRIIRQEVSYIPILGYSSNSDMRELCLDAGMDDFLQKPSTMEQMFLAINNLTASY